MTAAAQVPDGAPRRVLVLQRALPHYRVPFFELLRARLETHNVRLDLTHGQPYGAEGAKRDAGQLPWARPVRLRHVAVRGTELVWLPAYRDALEADLVVVEQANRNVINYLLQARRRLPAFLKGGQQPRLMLWGHGVNRQARRDHWGNRLKETMIHEADGWLAYTAGVAALIAGTGYPEDRITDARNAIDTRGLARDLQAVTAGELARYRTRLGLDGPAADTPIGLYCGGMYPEKQIPFLLSALREYWSEGGQMILLALGSGPDAGLFVQAQAQGLPVRHLGPQFGLDKALAYRLSRLALMPGLVGLSVLDSLVAGVPMVTTDYPYHSPEIDYLEHGLNGWRTPMVVADYARALSHLINDEAARGTLVEGCRETAPLYSIEQMAERAAEGILRCLNQPPYRGGGQA